MKDQFRELSADERGMLETLHFRGRAGFGYANASAALAVPNWRVRFFYQGNFTIAILRDPQSEKMRLGVAKRNSHLDPPRRIAGECQALRRAFLNPSINADDAGVDEALTLNLSDSKRTAAGG